MGSTAAGQALTGINQPEASCTCLTDMYIMMSELRTYTGTSFPLPLPTLRRSMAVAEQVLSCEQCPRDFSTSVQNIHMMCALLSSIGDSFRQLLRKINQEAADADARGERKQFRMGEMNPATAHLHTGSSDCPLGFSVELAAPEWRTLAKKSLLASFNGTHGAKGLMEIVQNMIDRQQMWHNSPNREHFAPTGDHTTMCNECEEPTCIRMVTHTQRIVETLAADLRSDT